MTWGKLGRRNSAPAGATYDPRQFVTTDARQNALDDFFIAPVSMSGTGLMPLWELASAEPPRDWVYSTNMVGIGGTPYNIPMQTPLVYDPRFTASYFADQGTT